jgi:hypothetical protein
MLLWGLTGASGGVEISQHAGSEDPAEPVWWHRGARACWDSNTLREGEKAGCSSHRRCQVHLWGWGSREGPRERGVSRDRDSMAGKEVSGSFWMSLTALQTKCLGARDFRTVGQISEGLRWGLWPVAAVSSWRRVRQRVSSPGGLLSSVSLPVKWGQQCPPIVSLQSAMT